MWKAIEAGATAYPAADLFMTGFADRAVLAGGTSADHLLQKPLYTADLVAKIERAPRTTSGRFDHIRSDPIV